MNMSAQPGSIVAVSPGASRGLTIKEID